MPQCRSHSHTGRASCVFTRAAVWSQCTSASSMCGMRMRCMSCDARACRQAGRQGEGDACGQHAGQVSMPLRDDLVIPPTQSPTRQGASACCRRWQVAAGPCKCTSSGHLKQTTLACLEAGGQQAQGCARRRLPWHAAGACGCTGSACHTAVQRCIWQAGSAQPFSNLRFIGCAARCDRPHIRTVSSVHTPHRCVRVHSQRQAWH